MPNLCSQFSLAQSLAQKRLRTEEPSPTWATATRAQQIVEPLGHTGVGPARVPQSHPLPLACSWRVQGNRRQEMVTELIFC